MFAVAYANVSILVTFNINRIVKYRSGEKCYPERITDWLFLKSRCSARIDFFREIF